MTLESFFKLDSDGNKLWSYPVKGTMIRIDSSYNIYIGGTVNYDFYAEKYSVTTGINEKKKTLNGVLIYPNPSHENLP